MTAGEGWLPAIVGRLVRAVDPARIVLFGSRVRGDARPDSDYDLVVVLDTVGDRREAWMRARRSFADLPVGADLVVVDRAEAAQPALTAFGALAWALREGRVVYERGGD